ncbi:MAG: protein kinase [Thermoanaerobaculia bacterium]|nr:protein kinase [Thermoanaerobaculia bacterium]
MATILPKMSLAPGRSLGPYEILAPLGAGGMGEVYEAKDTRLGRKVAIKVLPEGLAGNPERRARFEREARTVSRLSHPHVCTLHDVGEDDGVHFLVMEYLEGETLEQRLERGALPLEDTLCLGAQIAEALDAAHREGIVHRDLKPANVMLTSDGVKLLDFGLARVAAGVEGEVDDLPTMTMKQEQGLTEEGVVMGTFPYMAPEQVEGRKADARSDVFALGAVLYEMATGRRAFRGESPASVMASILGKHPEPLGEIEPASPPILEHVVSRCVAKDPEERWQSARDVAFDLRWAMEGGSGLGASAPVDEEERSRERLAWGLAVLAGLLAVAALLWGVSRIREQSQTIQEQRATIEAATEPFRTEVLPPSETGLAGVIEGAIALSPDGTRVVMIADGEGAPLLVRSFTSGRTLVLAGTEDAIFPFWSPDGEWIGFFADGKVKKIPAEGGPVQTLADAPQGRGGTWSRDGSIVYAPDIRGPLVRIPDSGGESSPVTEPKSETGTTHRNPYLLPGDRHVLYIARQDDDRTPKIVGSSIEEPGTPRLLVERGSNPQYADGFLFWVRDGNLLAQPFDPESLELSGSPTPIARGVEYFGPRAVGNFSVSSGGTLAWRRASAIRRQLARLDMEGRKVETYGEPAPMGIQDLSRDGRKVILARQDSSSGGQDLWVMDLERHQMTRVTFTNETFIEGRFSPEGDRIAVSTRPLGAPGPLWIQSASGSGRESRLLESSLFRIRGDWSPDGRTLIGMVQRAATGEDIAYLEIGDSVDSRDIAPFMDRPHIQTSPRFSTDGDWVAYASNETGRWEIYVSDFPEGERRWQVSRGDARGPFLTWSHGNGAIYYETEAGLREVAVGGGAGEIELGTRRTIELDISRYGTRSRFRKGHFRVGEDSILILEATESRSEEPIRIVRNWQSWLDEPRSGRSRD